MQKEWKQVVQTDVLKADSLGNAESSQRAEIPEEFGMAAAEAARNFHRGIPGYETTPLVELDGLSKVLGVKKIYAKDESKRFSLNAFKGLGGSYAMFRILCETLNLDPQKTQFQDLCRGEVREKISRITFVTATDGNHGRGVSWAAGLFGCRAYVFMPAGSAKARAEAIRNAGPARVTITNMNYDDTVNYALEQSEKNGWYLIQDTAWDGYEKIPAWIIQGYLTMALEMTEQLEEKNQVPTHVFLQAGVGAMAGGVLGFLAGKYTSSKPVVTIVEPEAANCIYCSAKAGDGKAHSVEGMPETIMAGLNCGTPCKITWPVLRDYAEYYMSCPDFAAAHGMRMYAKPQGGDEAVVSGESGASTMGALCLLMQKEGFEEIRKDMGLTKDSVILLVNTEGDTDPEGWKRIVEGGEYPLP